MPDDLNAILMECASLRGVYSLPHRTLHEFDVFVSFMIWGDLETMRNGVEPEYLAAIDRYRPRSPQRCSDTDTLLIDYALLFREYCREVYADVPDV